MTKFNEDLMENVELITDAIVHFMREVKTITAPIEKQHLAKLHSYGGITTNWQLYNTRTNPGFFTPFNQKVLVDSYQKPAGMKEARKTIGFLSALQLQTALSNGLHAAALLIQAASDAVNGDVQSAKLNATESAKPAVLAVYFTGALVINFFKEIMAFITRAIATLIEMSKPTHGKRTPYDNRNRMLDSFHKIPELEELETFDTDEAPTLSQS